MWSVRIYIFLWKVPMHYTEYSNFSAGLLVCFCQEFIPSLQWMGKYLNRHCETAEAIFSWVVSENPAIPIAMCGSPAYRHAVDVNAILTFIPTIRKEGSSMAGCCVKIKLNRCSVSFYYYLPPGLHCLLWWSHMQQLLNVQVHYNSYGPRNPAGDTKECKD